MVHWLPLTTARKQDGGTHIEYTKYLFIQAPLEDSRNNNLDIQGSDNQGSTDYCNSIIIIIMQVCLIIPCGVVEV